MSIFKSAIIAAALLGGFAGAASASEIDGWESQTVRFSVADLNLDSDAGAQAFLKRAAAAADTACGGRPTSRPLYFDAYRQYRKCHKAAMKDAVAQTNSDLVLAHFTGKGARVMVIASR
jgi:UrcA family protein